MVMRTPPTRKSAKAKNTGKPARAKPSAAKKAIGKKTPAKTTAASKPGARKGVKKPVTQKTVAKKGTVAKTARTTSAAKKTAPHKPANIPKVLKPADTPVVSKRSGRKITQEQALANTRALLEAKHEKAKQPPNYPTDDAVHPHSHGPHEGDSAQPETAPTDRITDAIHGHALATERSNQSKRGKR